MLFLLESLLHVHDLQGHIQHSTVDLLLVERDDVGVELSDIKSGILSDFERKQLDHSPYFRELLGVTNCLLSIIRPCWVRVGVACEQKQPEEVLTLIPKSRLTYSYLISL